MALSYKAKRRWALVILMVGLPIYLGVAWGVLSRLGLWELPVRWSSRSTCSSAWPGCSR